MEGKARTLNWFKDDQILFEIPFFQRPYVWSKPEWEELIHSIKTSNDNSMPFIGSFILQKSDKSNNYLVIDGQQRITTISVLVKAYVDAYQEIPEDVKPIFINIIYDIKRVGFKGHYTPRITPSIMDKNDFDIIMEKELDYSSLEGKSGLIIEAYKYFYNYFKNNDSEKNEYIGSKIITNNKFYIAIILDEEDDEQKIFDSVNSLGKDLTSSDIIKNYLFQRMKIITGNNNVYNQQILDIHNKYWMEVFYSSERRSFWEKTKVLGRFVTNNLESFLKDFATIKKIYSPSNTGGLDGLSKAYKLYINDLSKFDELVSFTKELSSYAESYFEMTTTYESCTGFRISDVINTTLLILDKSETSTFNPYILKLVRNKPEGYIDEIKELQKFIVQRIIYKAKTKNYNKVCENLLDDNRNRIKYLQDYNNNEPMGLDGFPTGLTLVTNKTATLILFLVEMIKRNGEEDKYSDDLIYNQSLEHIMPKKWATHWFKTKCYIPNPNGNKPEYIEITDNERIEEIRKKSIVDIGNMTLLKSSLNTSISNNSFKVKIEGNNKKDGIRKYVGSLNVAKEIVDIYDEQQSWDERDIHKRNKLLFDDLNDYYNFI